MSLTKTVEDHYSFKVYWIIHHREYDFTAPQKSSDLQLSYKYILSNKMRKSTKKLRKEYIEII